MDIYTIQEEAYKRGYEAGVKSVAYKVSPTADRERLLDLLAQGRDKGNEMCGKQDGCDKCEYQAPKACLWGFIADHLIANGVTIPVRCKDCKQWCRNNGITDSPNGNCFYHDATTNGYDFCSYGERKDNGM